MAEKKLRKPAGRKDPPVSERSKILAGAVKGIEGFRLWSQVEQPMIMPTRITSLNRAMRCGGIPGGMLGVLHGPSQGGKSLLVAELIYDAWATGGWGLIVDAECRAVDLKWYEVICGNLDEVAYSKPRNYEACIDGVEKYRAKFRKAKDEKKIPPEGMLCIGVDSATRLAPSSELEELLEGDIKTRGYPLRAMMTSRWLDRLIPTLEKDEIIAFVTRESQNLDAQPGQRTWKVKGGSAQIYDGGWVWRVTSVAKVRQEVKGAKKAEDGKKKKESKVLVGEKHEIEVLKNSMGPHLDEVANFYSAVGAAGEPKGLDFVREVREESILRGVVKYKSGTGYLDAETGEVLADSKVDYLNWLRAGDPKNWRALAEKLNGQIEAN